MAANKNNRVIRFVLKDEDYRSFGRYRIMYTKDGRKMVNRQRITYLISGIAIAVLFTVFHVDASFTKLAYAVAAVIGIGGVVFAEKLLLRQQDKAIVNSQDSIERIHASENVITFGDESFETVAGDDVQNLKYKDIKQIDLTEEAIYVWMSDTVIMPLPAHAFRGMPEMKELYNWIRDKAKEQGGSLVDDE